MWIEALFLFLIAGYLDNVLPQEFGVQKKPLFFLKSPWKLFKKYILKIHGKKDTDILLDTQVKNEDSDVAAERSKVEAGTLSPHDYPVIIYRVNKTYKSAGQEPKVAVANTSFAMPNGECFGLLGPNGAGKTTTISILTGLFPPSEGTAQICGYDIRTVMDSIHKLIVICPQFDILWGKLTCSETLYFYSRLKGIFGKDADRTVEETLKGVDLWDSRNKLVNELSGGMRRRLSVAVSFIGEPKVIFLDEPTTGLDPVSRRSLWDLLLKIKENKCVVLTTHSMEEADILCTRIGIMANGSLRCIGTNVALKNKFGEGYILKINFNPENTEAVTGFISKILPQARLEETFPGNYSYQIPRGTLVMSELFVNMVKYKDQYQILDWGVSQTSLEDVFLNISKHAQEEEKVKKK